jgi:hypothetical protein
MRESQTDAQHMIVPRDSPSLMDGRIIESPLQILQAHARHVAVRRNASSRGPPENKLEVVGLFSY